MMPPKVKLDGRSGVVKPVDGGVTRITWVTIPLPSQRKSLRWRFPYGKFLVKNFD